MKWPQPRVPGSRSGVTVTYCDCCLVEPLTDTSVLPSPVRISAISPSCRIMPPMSCTSNGRMLSTRREPSRTTCAVERDASAHHVFDNSVERCEVRVPC